MANFIDSEMLRQTKQERLRLDIFNAIQDLIIQQVSEQVFEQTEERNEEKSSYYRRENLKVIYRAYQSLLKLKYRLSEKTIQRMVDEIYSSDFLQMFLEYYFNEYTPKEEIERVIDYITNHVDLNKINRDIFALVISYLKQKGCFKKAKGFGGETVI